MDESDAEEGSVIFMGGEHNNTRPDDTPGALNTLPSSPSKSSIDEHTWAAATTCSRGDEEEDYPDQEEYDILDGQEEDGLLEAGDLLGNVSCLYIPRDNEDGCERTTVVHAQ